MNTRLFDKIPAALRKGWEPSTEATAWVELLGPHVPEDVKRLPMPRDGGYLLSSPSQLLEKPNAFAEAIRLSMEGGVAEPVFQVLTNVYFLASVPSEGDCLMFHCPRDSETADVVSWSHETGEFYGPQAYDLPTALRVLEAEASSATVKKRATMLRPALGRWEIDAFPFSLLERSLEDDGVWEAAQPKRPRKFTAPESHFTFHHDRAWWVMQALISTAPSVPHIETQLEWIPDNALAHEAFADYPPTILYWMWRSFFMGEDERLDLVLQRAAGSKSRLVRDAAAHLATEGKKGALAKQREVVMAIVEQLTNPFKDRIEAGPITLVRDDALAGLAVTEATTVTVPECKGGHPANAKWGDKPRVVIAHPDGKRLMVMGFHDHPRKGRHASIPNTLDALLEIDIETRAATVFCTVEDACQFATWGTYWSDDQILVGSHDGKLQLFERHSGRGVLVESIKTRQHKVLLLPDRDAIVMYGGISRWSGEGERTVPESIEVLRMVDRSLMHIANVEVALAVVFEHDGELVGNNADGTVGYRLEGLERPAERSDKIEFRPSAFVEMKFDDRIGPAAVVNAIRPCDSSFQSPTGVCLVVRKSMEPPTTWRAYIGREDGLHDTNPILDDSIGVHEFMSPVRSYVRTLTAAYSVDLESGVLQKLFDLPTEGLSLTVVKDGFSVIVEGDLLLLNLAGEEIRRIAVGAGAGLYGSLLGGTALAFKTAHTPLAIVAVSGKDVRLLGAVRPDDGDLASATFMVAPRPAGHYRLFGRLGSTLLKPHGLVAAIADESYGAAVGDELPTSPWEQAPVLELRM